MFCSIISAVIRGLEGVLVHTQVDISDGLPSFEMVGLLNSEVREARERVRSALKNIGVNIPPKKITINLSPAAIRKEGTNFDLPIAVGILCATGIVKNLDFDDYLFAGELSLDGRVESIRGALPIVLSAREKGIKRCFIPISNVREASVVEDVEVIGISDLSELIMLLNSDIGEIYKAHMLSSVREEKEKNEKTKGEKTKGEKTKDEKSKGEKSKGEKGASSVEKVDFADVKGQECVIRAALIAAAGMHHFLMIGPPGSGKSMIASRMPTILTRPSYEECLEITRVYSISGELKEDGIIKIRPFRAPHNTSTTPALIGGGGKPRCGEISLAHKGVLFLDELTEFKSETIDSLRQPLEEKKVTITRAEGNYTFPADFMLVAASNPCKCGYYPDRNRCSCSEMDVKRYLSKISGPILDRIDICINTPIVKIEDIKPDRDTMKKSMSSKELFSVVDRTQKLQRERFKDEDILFNSQMTGKHIEKYSNILPSACELLEKAYNSMGFSARTYYKIIKVARTIADIDEDIYIEEKHIAEALGYRVIYEH